MKVRNAQIDLLRVVAMLMIRCLHWLRQSQPYKLNYL